MGCVDLYVFIFKKKFWERVWARGEEEESKITRKKKVRIKREIWKRGEEKKTEHREKREKKIFFKRRRERME